ncbi:MAG: FlgD immunoglobulin-like domain containing protein [Verrucomicrobiota bacterium]
MFTYNRIAHANAGIQHLVIWALFALAIPVCLAASLDEAEFSVISGPASPQVAWAVLQDGDGLRLAFKLEPTTAASPKLAVGVSADHTLVLGERDATATRIGEQVLYEFQVKGATLVDTPAGWQRLRLGFAVSWPGGSGGQDQQRERYAHLDSAAPHTGLSRSPIDWMPLDLVEHRREVGDRRLALAIAFEQPLDGKATVVIEDDQGRRIRNLVSGQPYGKGPARVAWDGLDEDGVVVKPGAYHWRSIHHPGIRPEHLFSFCNDGQPTWRTGTGTDMWGADHSVFVSAAANARFTFFGGSVAESGYAMVAVDQQGVKRMHYNPLAGTGIERVFLAADDQQLYAAHDGFAWGDKTKRGKSDWKGIQKITLTRFDIATGRVRDYPGHRFAVLATNEIGPGSAHPDWKEPSLRGMTLIGSSLYVSDHHADRILVVEAKTGRVEREIKLPQPGALAEMRGQLLAVSEDRLVRIEGVTVKPLNIPANLKPQGIVASKDRIYVTDGATHTVMILEANGARLSSLGTLGGAYQGAYDPKRMVNPRGLALANNGWLWVTEDRWNPKRLTAWDVAAGRVVVEKFGPTAYGAPGAGFDTADASRWIGQGALWQVDLKQQRVQCRSILQQEPTGPAASATHWSFLHQDGRTFLIGFGKVTSINELKPDGSMKPLAFVASTHQYGYACNWRPPQAFIDAFNKTYPAKPYRSGAVMDKGPGVLWVDRNGDREIQSEELDFSTEVERFAGSGWGHDQHDLTLRLPATFNGKTVLVTLKPNGYNAGGAPNYPTLNAACAAGIPIALQHNERESAVDRFNNLLVNSDPKMSAFAPDGRLLWTYPNRWSNVHGSHAAPLPEIGVMQGVLFFLGMAELDAKSDVFVCNGNHGRFFVLTSDGLYLDEMFKDVRMGSALDAYLIGGECFGGFFGRSKTDGNYYLQSGHTDYRIFRIEGLNQVRRQEGTLTVSAAQALAAERVLAGRIAQQSPKRQAVLARLTTPPVVDGRGTGFTGAPVISWDKSGKFPVRVWAGFDARNLYLSYQVADESPWVNNGKDWTTLFKTGDSVDLQLGTDTSAPPARSGPVPGDLRLLMAPFEGKPVAVLYRHRLPAKENPVTFTCPWRSETVDSVKLLAEVKIQVRRENNSYRVDAAIPWTELGLKEPAGKTFAADFGVIYGDSGGAVNLLRSYWSNQNTSLVNDVPGEIMLTPNLWGSITFAEGK